MNKPKTTQEKILFFKELEKYNIFRPDSEGSLYKYVNKDTAIKILTNHSMKFSTSIELNDNDLDSGLITQNYPHKMLLEMNNTILKEQINSLLPNSGRRERRATFRKNKIELSNNVLGVEESNKEWHRAFEHQKKTIGIFCATTSSNKKYMWESDRYGDCERGFCIEYKFDSLLNDAFNAFKVNYDSKMQGKNYLNKNGKPDEIAIVRWLCTKNENYINEDEVRLISKIGSVGILQAPISAFRAVYHGKKTPQTDIEEIETILNEVGYNFKKIKEAIY